MSKRNTQQRRRNIVSLVNEQGEASVELLAQTFETSEVTIRKDLTELERSGLLLRRFGGAVSVPQEFVTDQPVSAAKEAIGQMAASLIGEHQRVVIDSGRTTAAMIPHLEHKEGLVVMTNSLNVANAIHALEKAPTLLMTGGTWDPHSEAFQGRVAEQVLRSYNFDQLFIGADGIDIERGSTTFNELIGLSKVMADVSRDVVVMVESDKIGRKMPNLELDWSQISAVITDSHLSQSQAKAIEAAGVRLYVAPID
ncbi:DeoR/GlpR family DNA-binding transcription regulator [Paraferrimonas sedimenticola]|uniref:GlmR transcriptional regulator n=1 Tax=Paraferrimonas sedimenticola TaxID=375674 RepID=A0AA37RZ55_9GAMM|nr:DeoR family transcriptional regulator [Paraferrimonas sedimenticola]GLP97649.1 GlmR transcriptional regulator [Paraferrimonas sedimenticola]